MELKLKCTNDCYLETSNFKCKVGDIIFALILDSDKGGIRLQCPDGSYSFPYYISDIEKSFTAIWEDK